MKENTSTLKKYKSREFSNIVTFLGAVASGKSNAIIQTIAKNPKVITIFFNIDHWKDYIRDIDTVISMDELGNFHNKKEFNNPLPSLFTVEGNRIFLNISDVSEIFVSRIQDMMKAIAANMDEEYIIVIDDSLYPEFSAVINSFTVLKGRNNCTVFIETQNAEWVQELNNGKLGPVDVVAFKMTDIQSINILCDEYATVFNKTIMSEKLLHLSCGEALYIPASGGAYPLKFEI